MQIPSHSESINSANLLALLQLCDPALPIGGFAHSAGLETYVQLGLVHDKETAAAFISQMLKDNLRCNDAVFLSLAYHAAVQHNIEEIFGLDNECSAVKLPMEMRQASQKLGMRLLKIIQPVCNNALLNQYLEAIVAKQADGHYCIAFGMYAAIMNIPKHEALLGFYYNATAGFVTNAVKLIPLGQQTGQELLFSFHPLIGQLALQSMDPSRDELGACCSGFDIRSMQHEQLYSRLYMS